nr:type VI secretion system protein [Oleiagrimonas soli]
MFTISIVVALVALLLIVVLMWRARRSKAAPKKPANKKPSRWSLHGLIDALRRRYAVIERAVRYVLARHDWRYRSPWLLLMGFPGHGKSSLVASIPDALLRRNTRGDARHEAYLKAGTRYAHWYFLDQGMLLDPETGVSAPPGQVEVDARWRALLDDIDSLRPDRALDGIVWVVSAERLLHADDTALHAEAAQAFQRIHEVQETFAFALPVYVVVSQCDAIHGFDAFWKAQSTSLRSEMIGWSSPTIDDNGTPDAWVEDAFNKLTRGLRELVLDAAASHDHIDDVDDFFLFPRAMNALQSALQRYLGVVFKPNSFETRAFCRGIYFTGAVDAVDTPSDAPRRDVSFIESLLRDKIFAERRLAQRTQRGLFARNRLIRRIQIGMTAAALLLAVALPWSAWRLDAQTQSLRSALADIHLSAKAQHQGCLDRDHVYALIAQVAHLDTHIGRVAIPLSWFDDRVSDGVAHEVSSKTLGTVVFPALACQLSLRIDELSRATLTTPAGESAPGRDFDAERSQLTQTLNELSALETNLDRLARLSEPGLRSERKAELQELADLALYVYGKPLPDVAMRTQSALTTALAETTYDGAPQISALQREGYTKRIDGMVRQVRNDLLKEVASGPRLLRDLQATRAPILRPLRAFNSWLDWINSSWLTSTTYDNPCERTRRAIAPGIEALIGVHHYNDSLRDALGYLDTPSCYQPAVDTLRQAQLTPYGSLFVVNKSTDQLQGVSPGFGREASGLKTLASLAFAQVERLQPFSCNGSVSGWKSGTFTEVLTQLRDYQNFIAAQPPSPLKGGVDNEPLYQRLALAQLSAVVERDIAQNQLGATDADTVPGLDATSQLDRQLASESSQLSAAVGPILQSQQQLRQLQLSPLADRVGQCMRNYASDRLADVSGLAVASQLYDPAVQSDSEGDAHVFDLGAPAVLQSYLNRQIERVQVLAGYAAPFVTLLKNSAGSDDSQRKNDQTDAFWGNTIDALNSAVQFSDPAGQAAKLDDFFTKQLQPMTFDNCSATLDAYTSPTVGNDLFSQRREAMLKVARMACSGHGQSSVDLHYYRIAMLFNSQIAGRYPFGASGSHEVSLSNVRAFFVYYDSEKPELETWLKTAQGDKAKQMRDFVQKLDAVETFLAGNLLATPQPQPIELAVGFRALPQKSPQSDQLIAWNLGAGDNAAVWPNGPTQVPWSFGQPLTLTLQWASGSRFMPLPDSRQSDLQVSGERALFSASGPWALLHLLDLHRTSAGTGDSALPDRQWLRFSVPTLTKSDAKTAPTAVSPDPTAFYLTLDLSAKDPKTKQPVTLDVPAFPQNAPVLW